MPKIGNSKSASEMPCERCHSKQKVSKTWTEKIKNDHGFMTLYHSQIICTNKVCQAEFEKSMLEDERKREKVKLAKLGDSTATRTISKPTPKATA